MGVLTVASALEDALRTAIGETNVGRTYRTLETTATCAAVVSWGRLISTPEEFGDPPGRERHWQMRVVVFLKDTGDVLDVFSRSLSAMDRIVTQLESDVTLGHSELEIGMVEGTFTPEEAVEAGGAAWIPFQVTVDVREWT